MSLKTLQMDLLLNEKQTPRAQRKQRIVGEVLAVNKAARPRTDEKISLNRDYAAQQSLKQA
jgi:hypothetical protein